MRSLRSRSRCRFSLAWLLGLALLLPVAQLAATWHGLSHAASHVAADSGDDAGDRQAPHAAHCDLCLTAAAVVGAALPGTGLVTALSSMRNAVPHFAFDGIRLALTTPVYRSRAPPLASI